jgi:pimeloyl-ACP methyl ester carboxylesterase
VPIVDRRPSVDAHRRPRGQPRRTLFIPPFVSHLDLYWASPEIAAFLRRLASFSRLIRFDKRGTGLSDPVAEIGTLEDRREDARAVLDACDSRQAALFGLSEGGPMSLLFGDLSRANDGARHVRGLRKAGAGQPPSSRRRSGVMSRAAPGEVLVTGAVRDLVVGSGIDWREAVLPFLPRAAHDFWTDRFPLLAPEAITPLTNMVDRSACAPRRRSRPCSARARAPTGCASRWTGGFKPNS